MTIFNGGYAEAVDSGTIKLWSMKQLLFCIAQDESAFNELDSFSLLGFTTILGEIGYEIEVAHNRTNDSLEAAIKRHAKLRAAIAGLKESKNLIGGSDLDQILKADQEVTHES